MRNGGYDNPTANGDSTGYSLFNVSGSGTVNLAGTTALGRGVATATGTNVNILNITGGSFNQTGGTLFLGYSGGSTGIVNISGGILNNTSGNAINLNSGGAPTAAQTTNAILNLNGGVVKTESNH